MRMRRRGSVPKSRLKGVAAPSRRPIQVEPPPNRRTICSQRTVLLRLCAVPEISGAAELQSSNSRDSSRAPQHVQDQSFEYRPRRYRKLTRANRSEQWSLCAQVNLRLATVNGRPLPLFTCWLRAPITRSLVPKAFRFFIELHE